MYQQKKIKEIKINHCLIEKKLNARWRLKKRNGYSSTCNRPIFCPPWGWEPVGNGRVNKINNTLGLMGPPWSRWFRVHTVSSPAICTELWKINCKRTFSLIHVPNTFERIIIQNVRITTRTNVIGINGRREMINLITIRSPLIYTIPVTKQIIC